LISDIKNLQQAMTPINTALCSFGMSGWVFHAPFLTINPAFRLYAVWERSKDLAQQKYPGIRTVRTLEEILSDEAIELVVVNSPNQTHFEYAARALKAGKHVVIEKPFTTTVEEAHQLIDLATEHQRVLSVYHNRRYDSDYKTIKNVLSQNLLGPVVEGELHFDRFKETLGPKLHKELPGPGAGSLYDLGAHLIDQALQLFGNPDRLFADITSYRPQSKVTDYFEILFYYPDKRIRIKSSYIVREPLPGYIFHGRKGSFIKPKTNIQEEALVAGKSPGAPDWGVEPQSEWGMLHTELEGKEVREFIASERGNYNEYYNGIRDAIRSGGAIPVTAQEALQVIRVIEAAYRSSETGKIVSLQTGS